MARRNLLLLLLVVTSIVLASIACGSPSESPTESPADATPTSQAADGTPTTEAPDPTDSFGGPPPTLEEARETWPFMVFDVTPSSFQEAPILAQRVESGDLPPLSERLPEDYAVIRPGEPQGVGVYGGTWRSVFTGPSDFQNVQRITHNHMLFWTADLNEITPHILKDWEANDDNTEFTFHMRRGMKWSDGYPFTADDVMFWYEDMLLNDDVLPAKPAWARAGGELGVWEKVDDYTFTVTFVESYGLFPDQVASLSVGSNFASLQPCGGMISPKHYMQQFHANHVGEAEANRLATEEGFDNWSRMFCQKNNPLENPEAPSTAAWVATPGNGFTSNIAEFVRNPYYWAVDTEGNQLPYIDRITFELVQDLEVLNLKAIAGDYDIQNRHMDVDKLPVFLENQERGGYNVQLNKSAVSGGSSTGIAFNQDWDGDPELASFIQNADFRRALSMAIDRDQINEVFFLGLSRPASTCAWPDPPYAPGEEYDQLYSTLDLEEANRLLDSIGLTERDGEGYRLLPSGERLELRILTPGGLFQDWPGQMEMVVEHWRENVGIRARVDVVERSLREQRLRSNDAQLAVWGTNGSSGLWLFPENSFAWDWMSMMAPLAGMWLQDPSTGREPDGIVREQQLLYEQALKSAPEDRVSLGQEIHRIRCEQVFYIGTVTGAGLGALWIVNNDVAPLPKGIIGSVHAQNPGSVWTETWYFKSGEPGVPAD